MDFGEFQLKKGALAAQTDEIVRLRARLQQNEAKLRRWARIKSKAFRRIHGRDQRAAKLQRLQEKLAIGAEAAQAAGMEQLARDLLGAKEDFAAGVHDGGV